LWFGRVPEGKVVKNRVHLDLMPDTVMRKRSSGWWSWGASVQRVFEDEGIRWTVMLDPERNEFCVQSPR
jgi:Glyoxalase-like domain